MTVPRPPIKPVTTAPTMNLAHGKAWRIDLPAVRVRLKVNPEQDAAIDAWLIEAPWAHPAWHSYLVIVIHLRPMPGTEPPILYNPHATHELIVMALDPNGDRDHLLEHSLSDHCRTLEPPNYIGQIVEITDDLARDRVRRAVEMICQGDLSPDTDYRAQWVAMFGDHAMRERAQ